MWLLESDGEEERPLRSVGSEGGDGVGGEVVVEYLVLILQQPRHTHTDQIQATI